MNRTGDLRATCGLSWTCSDRLSGLLCPPCWTVVLAQRVPLCLLICLICLNILAPVPSARIHSPLHLFILNKAPRTVADFLWQPPTSVGLGTLPSVPIIPRMEHITLQFFMHRSHLRPGVLWDWNSCPGPLCTLVGSITVSEVTFKPCVKITS